MSVDRASGEESSGTSAIRSQRLRDPVVKERLRQIHDQIDTGGYMSPGISGEDLPDFLREQREQLDT